MLRGAGVVGRASLAVEDRFGVFASDPAPKAGGDERPLRPRHLRLRPAGRLAVKVRVERVALTGRVQVARSEGLDRHGVGWQVGARVPVATELSDADGGPPVIGAVLRRGGGGLAGAAPFVVPSRLVRRALQCRWRHPTNGVVR
jgi:hypothetical protein